MGLRRPLLCDFDFAGLGFGKVVQEGASGLNGKLIGEREEVLVAGDKDGSLLLRER